MDIMLPPPSVSTSLALALQPGCGECPLPRERVHHPSLPLPTAAIAARPSRYRTNPSHLLRSLCFYDRQATDKAIERLHRLLPTWFSPSGCRLPSAAYAGRKQPLPAL